MYGLKLLKKVFEKAEKIVIKPKPRELSYPWFKEFRADNIVIPDKLSGRLLEDIPILPNLSAPILFMARGHSGTRALAQILEAAGVYIGDMEDKNSLNSMYDSLYWAYGFQRRLLPKLFKPGVGCLVNEHIVMKVALECLRPHLRSYSGGLWGFKTCAGMFSHPLYRYVFPQAKYIYLIRDGRDVILSDGGFHFLTNPRSRYRFKEYFTITTFGISNDINSCPFKFPDKLHRNDELMRNKYWVQAKSWREHVRMTEHLRKTLQLSPNVYTIRYEDICNDPIPILEGLFEFLGIELSSEVKNFSTQIFYTKSIGRWTNYKKYVNNCREDMEAVFDSMYDELGLLGYTE